MIIFKLFVLVAAVAFVLGMYYEHKQIDAVRAPLLERLRQYAKEDERKHRERLAEEDAELAFDINQAAKRSLARALDKQRGER